MPPKRKKAGSKTATAQKSSSSSSAKKKKTASSASSDQSSSCSSAGTVVETESSSGASNVASSLSTPEEIFAHFSDEERDNEVITLQGISDICEVRRLFVYPLIAFTYPNLFQYHGAEKFIGLDAGTDIRALFMCWKLGSREKPGEFNRKEFINGMSRLGARSLSDLKKKLPEFDPGFLDSDEYKDFFRWTFLFNLEGTKKTLEQEVVVELLPLAITDRSRFTTAFLEFLPTSNVSRISVSETHRSIQFYRYLLGIL